MEILIDSSVLIAAERGTFDLGSFLEQHAGDGFAMSAVTASELLHGVHRADPERRPRREAFVENLLSQIPVVAFDLVAARIHARIWSELASQGRAAGAHDLMIAASALAAGAEVATHDLRSFPNVPGLSTIAL
jgi:predicted nucleic acid-binding protein